MAVLVDDADWPTRYSQHREGGLEGPHRAWLTPDGNALGWQGW